MAKLLYSAICSLDGFVADAGGDFGFAFPEPEVLAAVNADTARIGTFLHGRRMYELMQGWETDPSWAEGDAGEAEFARHWQRAEKVVVSTTLQDVVTARTRLVRSFDPAEVAALVRDAELDVTVDGPTLAAHAFRAGLVDEVHLLLAPAVVGRGLRALPDDVPLALELLSTRRVGGFVAVRHAVRR
ncbi:Dihydrofolate reductase [Klenkia marina]|uniref:Dihydrofolate reductase n=1 Tax=Klenkia marina TaxID=1960309 RepID=A0A1G4YX18_9ACTN|nr:dihydrofolate reductase family protein [Klenkia marina]SCX57996.1 Dihydrofolate reductase [Klenkia marina]